MTQHQMKNIGNGNEPDAPLWYTAELRIPEMIGTFKASIKATSEEEARKAVESCKWYANETPLRLLAVTIESLCIQ